MRAVCVRGIKPSGLNKKNLSDSTVASYPGCGISLLLGEGGGLCAGKNTSAVLCAKNTGGAYARGGAYLRDTTVYIN